MSEFDKAIDAVIEHEGGFTVDHAGPTNFGVTLPVLRAQPDLDGDDFPDGDIDQDGDVDWADIKAMKREDAVQVYRHQWWDRYNYGEIDSQAVAGKVFDLSINMGPRQAHKLLQRALRAAGDQVIVDGVIGPQTIGACNSVNANQLYVALRSEAAGFYRLVVARHPEHVKYINGWLNRAYA